jgi:hypothetical protein
METAKRARKAETPKQPSPYLRLRAPYLYPDRPGKGNEPPRRESSLGLMEVTTWAKRRQSSARAVTKVKRVSLVK